MLDKLPQALGLVLVDDVDSSTHRLFDAGSVLGEFESLVFTIELSDIVGTVENDWDFCVWEVHETIGFGVVYSQAVVVVDVVALVLVRLMWDKFEN